jgi:hypothetical protein
MEFLDTFYQGGIDLRRINISHMVFILKRPGAVDVDAFRPICLQNCNLKILCKILTTRVQNEIPKLIDIHQTSFIKGRSIADTFVYALELVQVCHKRKKPAIVLKLDFAKAFDTVKSIGKAYSGCFGLEVSVRDGLGGLACCSPHTCSCSTDALVHGLPVGVDSGKGTPSPPTCSCWWLKPCRCCLKIMMAFDI